MDIELTSTAFAHKGVIPTRHTADGEDISPPLAWSGVPEGTKELALICEDPDAATPEPWVHWVIYKIPPSLSELPEGIEEKPRPKQPAGVFQGKNSWPSGQTVGYRGPDPPLGTGEHRYLFRLYALDGKVAASAGLTKKQLMAEIPEHILAEGVLMGTYKR